MSQDKNNKPDLTTRAGVAEILEASGLFNNDYRQQITEPCDCIGGREYFKGPICTKCSGFSCKISMSKPWLTANQSEAILEKLGVQVVWFDSHDRWVIVKSRKFWFSKLQQLYFYLFSRVEVLSREIPRQDRELANAAAVARYCAYEPQASKEVMG